jgi:hypothetical protein
MGDLMVRTTEITKQGCQVKTTVRKMPDGALSEDIVLQCEDIDEPTLLQLVESDTGRWMVAT